MINKQVQLNCSGAELQSKKHDEVPNIHHGCSYDTHAEFRPADRHALLNQTRLYDIENLGTGPIIFASDTRGIEICCYAGTLCRRGQELGTLLCAELMNEAKYAVDGSTGAFGTSMQDIRISQAKSMGHASGREMDPLDIVLQDAFGKPASIQATLVVSMKADGVELSGALVIGISVNGIATIKGLVLTALPGVYNLTFSVTVTEAGRDIHTQEKTFSVTFRNCTIGEVSRDDGRRCERCQENTYNFDSSFGNHNP